MRTIARFALTLTALAACAAASAQPYSTSDQERRERNRQEVLAKYGEPGRAAERRADERTTLREKTHHVAEKTRAFGHRQAQKMRNFSDRQNDRYGRAPAAKPNPYNNGPQ